jgi:mono/diheme cytochrome c family protein
MNIHRLIVGLIGVAATNAAVAEPGQQASQVEIGHQVFAHVCAPCHGKGPGTDGAKMLPGTAALDAKYQGKIPPALENRSGLSADVLRNFVRNGIGAMPMFRKTEVTDGDIEAIAAYLAQTAQQKN